MTKKSKKLSSISIRNNSLTIGPDGSLPWQDLKDFIKDAAQARKIKPKNLRLDLRVRYEQPEDEKAYILNGFDVYIDIYVSKI